APHLRGGRIDAQKLAGQAKALAVGERDLEHARLLVQQDLGGCRIVGVQTGHSRASWLIEDEDLSAVRQSQRSSRTCTWLSWMRTGKVSVGSYAGAVSASPVRMQKRAPWRGQTITSPSIVPPVSCPASCVHTSAIA